MTNSDKRKQHKTRPSALCHYARTMSNGPRQYRDQNVWCAAFSFYWRRVISGTVIVRDIQASNILWLHVLIYILFQWHEFFILVKLQNWDDLNVSLIWLMPLFFMFSAFLQRRRFISQSHSWKRLVVHKMITWKLKYQLIHKNFTDKCGVRG